MSTSVLPQLLEVDSELSAQATALEAQLTELQEKRKGIQTVIAMFESGNAPDIQDIAAITSGSADKTSDKTSDESSDSSSATKTPTTRKTTAKAKGTKTKAKRGRPAKAKTVEAASSQPAAETAEETSEKKAAKRSGRTANWQRYVQESYSETALPDVIGGVLQAQPGNVFKIADVMNAVFKEDMPKNHFLKARNRVSNILSAGARDGDWYRGRGGTYSVSEKAVKAS